MKHADLISRLVTFGLSFLGRLLKKIMLIAFGICIPFIAYFVIYAVQINYESKAISQLKELYIKDNESIPEILLQPRALAYVCSYTDLSKDNICKEYKQLSDIKTYALIIGFIFIAWFIGISILGIIGQIHRFLLVGIFTSGMYISIFLGIILLSANGILVIAAIYYAESVAIGRVHVGIIFSIGIAICIGVKNLILPAFRAIRKSEIRVKGKIIQEDEFSEIWKVIREAASKLKALPPKHLVVGFDETFFVTESKVYCFDDVLMGRTMFLSLPLMRQLEKEELLAIIGHELGHFRGADTIYSQRFYPIYRGTSESLHNIYSGISSSGGIVFFPVFALFVHFMEVFSKIETKIGRKRELVADSAGSELTANKWMGSALTKIYAYSGIWNFIIEKRMIEAIGEGKQITNCAVFYGEILEVLDEEFFNDNLKHATLQHPTDTHPSLDIRLQELGAKLVNFKPFIKSKPINSAIQLISKNENIEKELSDLEHLILIKSGVATPPESLLRVDNE